MLPVDTSKPKENSASELLSISLPWEERSVCYTLAE
jgi:hypothetical protein